MLEKFKFWKHDEAFHPEEPPALPPLQQMEPLGPAQDPNFQQMSQLTNHTSEKDLELIAAKLDVLKAQLDNILQRLDRIERSAQKPEPERIRW
ncbi:MAG TPA: hypothetical protein VLJ21_03500 [Candidatus Binatia bacterium]|nr:hypothetical protein [Candidatus Binatia bacterium]